MAPGRPGATTGARPAGPLDGFAAPRPGGWLPHPLTTDPARAEAEAAKLLAAHHPGFAGHTVRCLTARYRSHVCTLTPPLTPSGPAAVIKRHADAAAYLGETIAYATLADEAVLPELYELADDARTLIVEYIPHPAPLPGDLDELIGAVAAIHTAPLRWPATTRQAMSRWTLTALRAAPPPAWITDPAAWHTTLQLHADAYGTAAVPIGHLDLKADHARRRWPERPATGHGGLVLVDTETLRPDLTGLPDLITLAWITRELHENAGPHVRQTYLAHVTARGAAWTTPTLTTALRAFATATGLASLYELDR